MKVRSEQLQVTTTRSEPVKLCLVGYGYWGPKVARAIRNSKFAELTAIVERVESRRSMARQEFPGCAVHSEVSTLDLETCDAVVVATPPATHRQLTAHFLQMGKHVLVEKPIALNLVDAAELVRIAKDNKKILMVDHTYLFTDAVRLIRDQVSRGELGNLVHIDCLRVNLGIFQPDASVIWDLGVHDLAILEYVSGSSPVSVSASARKYRGSAHDAVGLLSLTYENGMTAYVTVSWVSPIKIRRTLLVGEKKSLLFDDISSDEKIRIMDSGVDLVGYQNDEILHSYRLGDSIIPRLATKEALIEEIEHFSECIRLKRQPISSGRDSLSIVATLTAAEESIARGGQSVRVFKEFK